MKLQAKLNYFITMIGKGLKAKGSITEPRGVQDSWISKSRKASEVHYFMWDFWISVDFRFLWDVKLDYGIRISRHTCITCKTLITADVHCYGVH